MRTYLRKTYLVPVVLVVGFLFCAAATPASAALWPRPPINRSYVQEHRVFYVERDISRHLWYRWRVGAARREWNAAGNITLRYGKCRSGYGCILVTAERNTAQPAVATTEFGELPDGHASTARVVLNPIGWPRHTRRCASAHELGHGLGLDHISTSESIMDPYCGSGTRSTPSPGDLYQVAVAHS